MATHPDDGLRIVFNTTLDGECVRTGDISCMKRFLHECVHTGEMKGMRQILQVNQQMQTVGCAEIGVVVCCEGYGAPLDSVLAQFNAALTCRIDCITRAPAGLDMSPEDAQTVNVPQSFMQWLCNLPVAHLKHGSTTKDQQPHGEVESIDNAQQGFQQQNCQGYVRVVLDSVSPPWRRCPHSEAFPCQARDGHAVDSHLLATPVQALDQLTNETVETMNNIQHVSERFGYQQHARVGPDSLSLSPERCQRRETFLHVNHERAQVDSHLLATPVRASVQQWNETVERIANVQQVSEEHVCQGHAPLSANSGSQPSEIPMHGSCPQQDRGGRARIDRCLLAASQQLEGGEGCPWWSSLGKSPEGGPWSSM